MCRPADEANADKPWQMPLWWAPQQHLPQSTQYLNDADDEANFQTLIMPLTCFSTNCHVSCLLNVYYISFNTLESICPCTPTHLRLKSKAS